MLFGQQQQKLVAFYNRGGGRFEPRTLFTAPTPAWDATSIQVVDFDRDGDLDVLVTNGETMDDATVERRIPVTAWGVGTSLEGNPIPVSHGIVLDFQEMQGILAVHPQDFQVDVQAGVVYKDLNKTLSRHGLFSRPIPARQPLSAG